MKTMLMLLMCMLITTGAQAAIFDDFEDGDFTYNPAWTVMYENSSDPWFINSGPTSNNLEMPGTGGSQIRLMLDQTYENEVVTVEFDLYSRWPSPVDYRPFSFSLFDTATLTGTEVWSTPSLTYGGGFGPGTQASGFAYTTGYNGTVAGGGLRGAMLGGYNDGWQHYTFVFDPIANNAKFYQDGVMVLNYSVGANKVNALELKQEGSIVKYQFDNVSVVPEPGTMILLALGSMVMIKRAK